MSEIPTNCHRLKNLRHNLRAKKLFSKKHHKWEAIDIHPAKCLKHIHFSLFPIYTSNILRFYAFLTKNILRFYAFWAK